MNRAMRLHEKHTREELADKIRELQSYPEARVIGGLSKLSPKHERLLKDLLLAHYWHCAPKGNKQMQSAPPQAKLW